MFEISPAIVILLGEAAMVLLILCIWLIFRNVRKQSQMQKAIAALVNQIHQQSTIRREETGSYLSEFYQLEDTELANAVKAIDRHEKKFLQIIIDVLAKNETDRIKTIDADLAELIDAYKKIKPKKVTVDAIDHEATRVELDQLVSENDMLREELAKNKKAMADTIGEFGNMFRGGGDNDLEQDEVSKNVITEDSASIDNELSEDKEIPEAKK